MYSLLNYRYYRYYRYKSRSYNVSENKLAKIYRYNRYALATTAYIGKLRSPTFVGEFFKLALQVHSQSGGKGALITISSDLRDLQKELKSFGRNKVVLAQSRSMNTALRRGKTAAKRGISLKRNLPAAETEKGLRIIFATPTRLNASIHAKGSMIPLTKLKGGVTNPKQKPLGVSVKVTKGKRTLIRSAFIATMPGGHVGVFKRKKGVGGEGVTGSGSGRVHRLPIQEQTVPSVAHTLVDAGVRAAVLSVFHTTYRLTLAKQLTAAIRRSNRKIRGGGR